MVHEIRSRLAALDLDRGDVVKAVQGLESAIAELRKVQVRFAVPARKNYATAHVSLMAAYIAGGKPDEAIEIARDLLLPLEELSRHGRWELNAVLAQARCNESSALLQLGRAAEAVEASERAVHLYEDLVEKGAVQFQGQLANAFFRRAEAHLQSGDEKQGRDDLWRALELSETCLETWYGECNIQSVFIQNALDILTRLPIAMVEEKHRILQMIAHCNKRMRVEKRCTAALRHDVEILRGQWSTLRSTALQIGMQWSDTFPNGDDGTST